MGGSRPYGDSIRVLGALNMVGILVGCNGTGDVFRHLRYRHGHVRLLLRHEAGIRIQVRVFFLLAEGRGEERVVL